MMLRSESSLTQRIFTDVWNAVVKKLQQLKYPTQLPFLNGDGSCCGLSFCLLDYLQNDREDEFFLLYTFLCKSNPEKLAFWLMANSDIHNPFIDKLFEFIYKIYVLQEKQHFLPIDQTRTSLWTGNFSRVNAETETVDQQRIFCCKDVSTPISHLQNNEALHLDVGHERGKLSHGIIVYRMNDTITVFDSNLGERKKFQEATEAAKFIIYRINLVFTPSHEINYLLACKNYYEFNLFPQDIRMITGKVKLKKLSEQHVKFVEQSDVPSIEADHFISQKAMQNVINSYVNNKKNRYFGLPWLTTSASIKQLSGTLFFVEDAKKRTNLAKEFVAQHDDDFAKHLLAHFPQLK